MFGSKPVGGTKNPLLIRHMLIRCPLFGIYLHEMLRSDYARALHDHPWPFVSVVLRGGYCEVHNQTPGRKETRLFRHRLSVAYRPAAWRHRVILFTGEPTWTLMLVGPRQRKWGFWIKGKWCWWRKHDPVKNICEDRILVTDQGD